MTTEAARIAEASAVRPSSRQLAWQALEFYGFIHFGINTMTNREWGLGHEDPSLFDPNTLDADQWVDSLASAGMRALLLTCKHHDGFCLWPSAVTSHSVAASPWRDGKGDLVAEVARACAKRDIRFGVYLSPWDRTEASYGTGKAYDDFLCAQLTELLTNYGPIFSVWFDGANGEGANGRKQFYDWDRYFALVRTLQPEAVINICGPDVRWCGNEAGHTRKDEWSVVPASLRDAERTASISQKIDDGQFSRLAKSDEDDLGSRTAILASNDPLVWYPSEVNTSIRPGWFYHSTEDDQVRSAEELFAIYCSSVGGNAAFLLNLPPDPSGLIAAPDRAVLAALGRKIANLYARDIAPAAAQSGLTLQWNKPQTVDGIILGEDIRHGQQIEGLTVEAQSSDGVWHTIARCTSVGYRRILMVDPVSLTALRVTITASRGPVHLTPIRVLGA